MIGEYIRSIEGIAVLGVVGLCLAIIFFFGVIVWVLRADKDHLRRMSELPLDGEGNHTTATRGHQ